MNSSSNISTHQTLEGAMLEHLSDTRGPTSVPGGTDKARTRLVDAETQTEANFFASTEVVRLISNSREELERRVRELERELNRIKQERDEAIVEAFDVSEAFVSLLRNPLIGVSAGTTPFSCARRYCRCTINPSAVID